MGSPNYVATFKDNIRMSLILADVHHRNYIITYMTKAIFSAFWKSANFLRTWVLFVGPLIPMFWTSGDVSSGFQSQSGQPYLYLAEAYMMYILWFPPLVQHLLTSWQPAWQLSCSHPCTCEQALVGLETRICHATTSQYETRQMLYRLTYAGLASLEVTFLLL